MTTIPVRLLLVEDDPDHAELFRLAFPDRQVQHVLDAEAAITALNEATDDPPDLVVLDLNLPGHSGITVLEMVRRHPQLERLPVAVLSTSRADRDRMAAAEAGADAYYEKPMGVEDFENLRGRIDTWWPEWVARSA